MTKLKKIIALALVVALMIPTFAGCKKETDLVIYSSAESFRIEYLRKRLEEKFPDYVIEVVELGTEAHAAKLLEEGRNTPCHISHGLSYNWLAKLDSVGLLAGMKDYDTGAFLDDAIWSDCYLPEQKNSGAIVVNTSVLAAKGLAKPTCFEDLLKPEYKGLISMPKPSESATGYMFLKMAVNTMGEDDAFYYFEQLKPNLLHFTTSAAGAMEDLTTGQAAIAFGNTVLATNAISQGEPLEILYLAEGAPYSLYGQSIIRGKEKEEIVKEVFTFLVNEFTPENYANFSPEQIYPGQSFAVANYPATIPYGDMSNNTLEEKERLLEMWPF